MSREQKFLLRVATHLLKVEQGMPLSRLHTLLLISRKGTCTVQDLVKATALGQPAIARQLGILGDANNKSLRLVETYPDPQEQRRLLVTLSPAGKRLMAELESLAD